MRRPTSPHKRILAKDGPTPAEQRWRPIVEEWRRSGAEMSGFCLQRGLSLCSFKNWKRELAVRDQRRQAKRAATEATRNALQLLPVRVLEQEPASSGSVEIVLRGGRTLRIGGDFDPAVLRKLVATLEEAR